MPDVNGDDVNHRRKAAELHLAIIGRFDQVIGGLAVLGAGWYLLLAHRMLGESAPLAPHFREWTGSFAALNALMGILSIWLGHKLLQRRPWARVAQIIFCAGNLPNFPVMTVFGLYGIWALAWGPAREAFRKQGNKRQAAQRNLQIQQSDVE